MQVVVRTGSIVITFDMMLSVASFGCIPHCAFIHFIYTFYL